MKTSVTTAWRILVVACRNRWLVGIGMQGKRKFLLGSNQYARKKIIFTCRQRKIIWKIKM